MVSLQPALLCRSFSEVQEEAHRFQRNGGGSYFSWMVGKPVGERFLFLEECYKICNNWAKISG